MSSTTTKWPLLLIFSLLASAALSQSPPAPDAEAPSPASDACNGVFLSYSYTTGKQIPPTNSSRQAYRFESTLTVLNNGADDLKSWRAFVGFRHGEYLVSAENAVRADGGAVPGFVENGTVFAGFPQTDLKTAIKTAGDLEQMRVRVKLVGSQFGVDPPAVPMPESISLANDGFSCPAPEMIGNTMQVCCVVDTTKKTNITVVEDFLPRQNGDLSIMYDVTKTYDASYYAQVSIENHNPLGRLDNWMLSWEWMEQEFINTMRGAYPSVVDFSECIFGPQGEYHKTVDFANVLSCAKRPSIVDLPPTMANDTKLGGFPNCCRNGTILPTTMDPKKSKSSFQIEVWKMPPNINRSTITPPQSWAINGTLNPHYNCGPPVRVSPSQFPDANGVPVNTTAIASWQVVCNITEPKGASPRCCVSFSAYYNESVIPCKTCACGCPSNTARTCSTTAPAMLLPPESLLVPFVNRTVKAKAWAELKHLADPNPTPCGDNCGVSINWHLYTDYAKGWTARVTLFNWGETNFADWFAAVQLDKATPGFEKMYSFNATTVVMDGVNNTVFMQGLEGLNYLVAEVDGKNPQKDPRVPGKQQSVISFTKKLTPDIDVVNSDGFPTKVFFNGQECSLPDIRPSNGIRMSSPTTIFAVFLMAVVFMLMQY